MIINLVKPNAQMVNIQITLGVELNLQFNPSADSIISRDGDNLVFTFADGGKIFLEDFYAQAADLLPIMDVQRRPKSAQRSFWPALAMKPCSPAVGPTADNTPDAAVQGGGFNPYGDNAGDLISGVDHLGMLGRNFWGNPVERPVT